MYELTIVLIKIKYQSELAHATSTSKESALDRR